MDPESIDLTLDLLGRWKGCFEPTMASPLDRVRSRCVGWCFFATFFCVAVY